MDPLPDEQRERFYPWYLDRNKFDHPWRVTEWAEPEPLVSPGLGAGRFANVVIPPEEED